MSDGRYVFYKSMKLPVNATKAQEWLSQAARVVERSASSTDAEISKRLTALGFDDGDDDIMISAVRDGSFPGFDYKLLHHKGSASPGEFAVISGPSADVGITGFALQAYIRTCDPDGMFATTWAHVIEGVGGTGGILIVNKDDIILDDASEALVERVEALLDEEYGEIE